MSATKTKQKLWKTTKCIEKLVIALVYEAATAHKFVSIKSEAFFFSSVYLSLLLWPFCTVEHLLAVLFGAMLLFATQFYLFVYAISQVHVV